MFSVKIFGRNNMLCAHGRAGQTQPHIFLRRISRSEIRNSAAAKARAGREFISPTPPFLPAPPERLVLVSAALRAAIIQDFAQKRFALRSVIATQKLRRSPKESNVWRPCAYSSNAFLITLAFIWSGSMVRVFGLFT